MLVFKKIDKNDLLILHLTTNLQRDGFVITEKDIETGSIKKDSIVIVLKMTAIDSSLISSKNKEVCQKLEC